MDGTGEPEIKGCESPDQRLKSRFGRILGRLGGKFRPCRTTWRKLTRGFQIQSRTRRLPRPSLRRLGPTPTAGVRAAFLRQVNGEA